LCEFFSGLSVYLVLEAFLMFSALFSQSSPWNNDLDRNGKYYEGVWVEIKKERQTQKGVFTISTTEHPWLTPWAPW
jgi:hypothetical protein